MADSLIRRASIQSSGTWWHVPPFNGDVLITPIMDVRRAPRSWNATERQIVTASRHMGWEINVRGSLRGLNMASALSLQRQLHSALFDASARGKLVDFNEWRDDASSYKGVYRRCRCTKAPGWASNRSARFAEFELCLETGVLLPEFTGSNGSKPGAGPYEQYIYNGVYVAAGGGPVEEGIVPLDQIYPFCDGWAALLEVTTAANELVMQKIHPVPLGGADSYKAIGLSITGCTVIGEDGPTRICVSDEPWDAAGTVFRCSVLADEGTADRVDFELPLPDGKLYVWADQAGGHAGVQYQVDVINA